MTSHPSVIHAKGLEALQRGEGQTAESLLRRAAAMSPGVAVFQYNLGLLLKRHNRLEEAVAAYRKALAADGNDADIAYNLGNALMAVGDTAAAVKAFEQAVALRPDWAFAHMNLAAALRDVKSWDKAGVHFDKAAALAPDHAEIRWNQTLFKLLTGDYAGGWEGYEWRFQRSRARQVYPHQLAVARWKGQWVDHLFVHAEQGLGDTLMFSRYLFLIKGKVGRISLEVPQTLAGLMRSNGIAAQIEVFSPHRPPQGDFDAAIPLMSLPGLLHTCLETIPAEVPYLRADPLKKAEWAEKTKGTGLKVGIMWSGSATDPGRSLAPESLGSLARLDGVCLYGLQPEPGSRDRQVMAELGMVSLGEHFRDFADTAGALANLDMVVSVDTAAAHLAGAMGMPVMVLLAYCADWRWLVDRPDSPWYPTMTLVRQDRPGWWDKPVAAACAVIRDTSNGPAACIRDSRGELAACLAAAKASAARGEHQNVIDDCRRVLENDPQHVQALHLMGLALKASGRNAEAVDILEKAVGIDPDRVEAWYDLGVLYHVSDDQGGAARAYATALTLRPDHAPALNNLGALFQAKARHDQAEACFTRAIAIDPGLAAAHNNLGKLCQQRGDAQGALHHLDLACKADPGFAEAFYNLGTSLLAAGHCRRAVQALRRAVTLNPDFADAHNNLGSALQEAGLPEAAARAFGRAVTIRPGLAQAHWNLALVRLLLGDYVRGFEGYEWRWRKDDHQAVCRHRHRLPLWDGRPFAGKRLYIHDEQGLGDAIQFARFLPMAKDLGGTVVFETRPALRDLFAGMAGIDELVTGKGDGDPAAPADLAAALMSLPGLLKTTLETLPRHVPYLLADARRRDVWRSRLPAGRFRVGLVWAGRPTRAHEALGLRRRSMALAQLTPVLSLKAATFVGLQQAGPADQVGALAGSLQFDNLGPELIDFADTAAVMDQLDLIITVDTAAAHLAGALGRPVWVLLPFAADWRWLVGCSDSPWYPTMRLFRQKQAGSWEMVAQEVAGALEGLVRGPATGEAHGGKRKRR